MNLRSHALQGCVPSVSTSVYALALEVLEPRLITCSKLYDHSYRPSKQRFMRYVLRASLPVLDVLGLRMVAGKEEVTRCIRVLADSCARHQCLCTGAEDLKPLFIMWCKLYDRLYRLSKQRFVRYVLRASLPVCMHWRWGLEHIRLVNTP